jgi:hypothetical protein
MFEFLPESRGRRVYLKAAGRLTDADYKALVPKLEAVIQAHRSIRLYVDMTALSGWSIKAAWDDMVFGLRHWNDFERLALVGDKRWQAIAAKAMDALSKGEVRCFPAAAAGEARAWIEET